MRFLLTILCLGSFGILNAQMVRQVQITVTPELKILTDVTADDDSILNGRYLIIYHNKTRIKGMTKNGEMDGIWTSYYPNGQQKMKGRYLQGLPHGQWTLWGEKGEVQAKFQYSNGIPAGHWQGFYFNHSKAVDIIYNPDGKPVQCVHYYEDDIIAINHEYTYEKGVEQANLSYYYNNYHLFHVEQRTDKELDGLFGMYHSNGLTWETFTYQNGRLLAVGQSHSRGGVPLKNTEFRHGNGTITRYYSGGNPYSKTSYTDGFKNDSIIIYDIAGKFVGLGHFKENHPIGKWELYSKFHKLNTTVDFNKIPGEEYVTNYTSSVPKEREEGALRHGYRHGSWKTYNGYGELTADLNYQFGWLHGPSLSYQSNKVLENFRFENDNRSGKSTYYSTFGDVNSEDIYDCESVLELKWEEAPEKNWITIRNETYHAHQKYLWFYPDWPGTELLNTRDSYAAKGEGMFLVQRGTSYNYAPELIPAQMDGGLSAEKDYIRKNLKIPELAKSKHIDGSVLLRYKIDQFGMISEVVILKSIGFGLDEAAVNVIKSFPPLNAATFNGIPIPSYEVREIDFKI